MSAIHQTTLPAAGFDVAQQPREPRYRAWAVEPDTFSTHRVSPIRHNFHEHPLMQLDALQRLANSLMPTQQCRFIDPGSRQDSKFHHEPRTQDGRSLEDVFRRIDEPGSWIALYNVQTDSIYNGFVREVMASVYSLVEREQPGIVDVGGFIFISAPPSVTPFHIDRENNFWLQVRGRKTLNVWAPTDREVVAAQDVEKFILHGDLENVRLQESLRSRSHQFDTGPGDGVYFPSTSPHMTRSDPGWTSPGDGVSISMGVVFYTAHTRHTAQVIAGNRLLRLAGMRPGDPGTNRTVDAVKAAIGRTLVRVQRFRGRAPAKGIL